MDLELELEKLSESKNLTTDDEFWKNESVALLALASIQGVGYWTLYKLAQMRTAFKQVLKIHNKEAFIAFLKELGSRSIKLSETEWSQQQQIVWEAGLRMYRHLSSIGIGVLHSGQIGFPKALKSIPDAPAWLFYQGNFSLLHTPSIAMVGARKSTRDGTFLTQFIVSLCRDFGVSTISGLADGIDQQVHSFSLRYNLPTIAILGTGILRNFPANSEELRENILNQNGLILTEYLPHQMYSAENFVRRNRLQSALSKIVIPIEWSSKGGTAHTVRFVSQHQRSLLCLRLPDWLPGNHAELALGEQLGGKVFTVPDDYEEIRAYIYSSLHSSLNAKNEDNQLMLSFDVEGRN